MSSTAIAAPLAIVHAPHGAGTPYFAAADERTPRDPVGGDMVGIGFLTMPGEAATGVALHWTRNGRPQAPIGGRALARHASLDQWLVEIGVVEAGDVVEYWIVAEAGGTACTSPHHRFVARRWRRLAAFTAASQQPDGLHLSTLAEDGTPGLALVARPQQGHASVIQLVFEQVQAAGGEPTGAAPAPVQANDLTLTLDPTTGRIHLRGPDDAPDLPVHLRWLEEGDGTLVAVELTAPLAADEALVGFGERFDALDQRGRALDATVYEQYKNQGNRTYLPVPFFFSNRGYGCLVEGTSPVRYDLGRTVPDRWRCVVDADSRGHVVVDLMTGAPLALVRTLTAITGRPAEAPPAWVFGPWMSSNEWNTQVRVEQEVALTRHHDIPATVLVIEAWSDETTFYIWNGARYTPRPGAEAPRLADFEFPADGPWPDPKGMVDALHAAGMRLVLWQIPALKQIDEPHAQHDGDVAYALGRGFVMRRRDGSPYRNPAFWFHEAHLPDFTQPAATAWWLQKRAYLLEEFGIDGFKTDGGEHLQGADLLAGDGRHGAELVNAYPNLYVGAYHAFARRLRGGDAITFSRAGYTGAGAFPAHWAGDENSTWEAYRRSLIAGLSAALSGVLFWSWDIAGFSDALPGAELYLRATAMGAFCPIMQYHSEYTPPGAPSKDRTPWNIQAHSGDARVIPLYRFFAQVRLELTPYLLREAAYAAAAGEPLMRPLLLDDPADPIAWQIVDQYRLGRDLLVAPVTEEGATTRRLYLPSGSWRDLWHGEAVEGGQWIEVAAPLDRIPVYVRAGAESPLSQRALEQAAQRVSQV